MFGYFSVICNLLLPEVVKDIPEGEYTVCKGVRVGITEPLFGITTKKNVLKINHPFVGNNFGNTLTKHYYTSQRYKDFLDPINQ